MLIFIVVIAAFIPLLEVNAHPGKQKGRRHDVSNVGVVRYCWLHHKIGNIHPTARFPWGIIKHYPPTNANKKCIDATIQAYSHKYSGRTISPTIRLILNQPKIATSPKFRDEAVTAFYLRTCYQLKTEIKTLKTTNARQRRVIKASELADIIIGRLTSNERQKYVECIREELANMSDIPPIIDPK